MNKLKNEPAKKASQKEAKEPRRFSAVSKQLFHLVDGTLLEGVVTPANLPFGMFVALMIGLYIANTYNAENTVRETSRIEKELKDLNNEYISMKSDLMFLSNQSQVAQRVEAINLKEAKIPPHKLFILPKDSITPAP